MTQNSTSTESLSSRLDAVITEYQICRRKLESKCEALLILSRELDQCRSERDQFKLMAEQLRDRYQMVKRQLTGDVPMSATIEIDPKTYSNIQTQTLARMLFDTKEANKSLKFELDDLRQKLQDAEGDIKLLREQIARSRVGTTDEGLNTRHFPAHEREELVRQLEASREEFVQLQRDLQQVLDEKEELVSERAAYRAKYERLNMELNYILGGDEKKIVDIDVLIMENNFLKERLKQMEEEKTMAIATVTKYKSILEKKKTKGILKLGQSRSDGLVITQKQVQQIMQGKSSVTPTPQALADLQGLCGALLDTINDKNLALSHQRKTNKLLGNRVNELEKKLKTLEVSGLWSVTGNYSNLEKLKADCEEIKTLVPHQFSQSTDSSSGAANNVSDFESSASSSAVNSPAHQKLNQLSRLDLEELDLLPPTEEVSKSAQDGDLLIYTQTAAGVTDPSLQLSDVMKQNSEALRIALAEAMLKSLMSHNSQHSSLDENWSTAADEVDEKDDCLDCDEREAVIHKCLIKKDSGDEMEELENYDYDDDEEDEASEEFKHLLETVTTKLLQRSQEFKKFKSPDPKINEKLKHQNVYITDFTNTIHQNEFTLDDATLESLSELRDNILNDDNCDALFEKQSNPSEAVSRIITAEDDDVISQAANNANTSLLTLDHSINQLKPVFEGLPLVLSLPLASDDQASGTRQCVDNFHLNEKVNFQQELDDSISVNSLITTQADQTDIPEITQDLRTDDEETLKLLLES
ncbi:hypothetical protein Btru_004265 [Bulinus truncatus]|nr:hypothetical protein Btru_004265 [Bulinus truncatus]